MEPYFYNPDAVSVSAETLTKLHEEDGLRHAVKVLRKTLSLTHMANALEEPIWRTRSRFPKEFYNSMTNDEFNVKVFIIPDVHIPFHNRRHWRNTLLAVKQERPDIIVVMGDFDDCQAYSSWDSKKKLVTDVGARKRELLQVEEMKRQIEETAFVVGHKKQPQLIVLEGNHEFRSRKFADENPKEKGLVETFAAIDWSNWKVIPFKSSIYIGGVEFTHGDFHGPDTTKKAMDSRRGNIVYGDTHTYQVRSFRDLQGNVFFAVTVGSLANIEKLRKLYVGNSNIPWVNGYAIADINLLTEQWQHRFINLPGGDYE